MTLPQPTARTSCPYPLSSARRMFYSRTRPRTANVWPRTRPPRAGPRLPATCVRVLGERGRAKVLPSHCWRGDPDSGATFGLAILAYSPDLQGPHVGGGGAAEHSDAGCRVSGGRLRPSRGRAPVALLMVAPSWRSIPLDRRPAGPLASLSEPVHVSHSHPHDRFQLCKRRHERSRWTFGSVSSPDAERAQYNERRRHREVAVGELNA